MVTKKESLERLGSVRLFDGLSKADIRILYEITKIVHHDEGHTIISEGDQGAGFQLILEGEARVVRGGRTVARLGPGEFYGEMALIDQGARTATVIAATPLTVLALRGVGLSTAGEAPAGDGLEAAGTSDRPVARGPEATGHAAGLKEGSLGLVSNPGPMGQRQGTLHVRFAHGQNPICGQLAGC